MSDGIAPRLYLCATPIGNLGDITYRVVETLRGVSAVYCEDTRNALKLLNHFEIRKPVYSCHEHNEAQRAKELCGIVRAGQAVAFVSDAGMPAVSDPGARLISEFIAENLPFEVLPGASAMVNAWLMSGLPTDKLFFRGFLPRSGKERADAIAELRSVSATSVIYESPLRVGSTLKELYEKLGERQCALVREITKLHEEAVRGSISVLAERYSAEPPKGECVIVLAAAETVPNVDGEKLNELLSMLFDAGVKIKDAARIASKLMNIPKNDAYRAAMALNE
ncbi:MAG: 16S rRNA (cytidine(1402)-2'-O)-methyltransferase [Christensenellaceae bacterium]|nr:16S rRNA (cytidine(1402)-2'-O)-methyltransferase [Christensenellaceae bacterium]